MTLTPARQRLLLLLVSFFLIALEVVWTRVLSAEFFYTFAFLILSLAVLGLGLGGLAVRLLPRLAKAEALAPTLLATALLSLAGPLLVLRLGLDFSRIFSSGSALGLLALTIGILCSAFFSGGMAVSLLFRLGHVDMPKLYRADLVGAALGVLAAVVLMNSVGTPATVLLLPLVPLVAAALCARKVTGLLCLALAALPFALLPYRETLVAKPRQERLPVITRHWDAMGLVKIQQGEGYRNLNIDNAANTPVNEFDGDWEGLRAQSSAFFLDPQPLMQPLGTNCRFLSIGAGGGGDVLMALKNNAGEVHAVEVNPFINRALLPGGALFDYSGKLYADARVQVITEDARSYLRRQEKRFDIIYSLSSNTFAALASGAFALAENYLFTTESFRDSYQALSERGFLIVEHQFYVPRLVSEALEGLRQCGVEQPERHLAVYSLPRYGRQVLLVGKAPLTEQQIERPFLALDSGDPQLMHRVYPRPAPEAKPLVSRIVTEGWRAVQPQVPIDLSPSDDNRPFAAQMGLFKNLKRESFGTLDALEYRGFPVAKLLIAVVLGLVTLLVLPLSFLPFATKGPHLRALPWLYFFCIGAGFMIVEVVLLQQFTLIIGPSSYTLAVLLFSLLLFSGLGSRYSASFGDISPFLGILVWVALDLLFFGVCADLLAFLPLWGRMAVSALLIAPLGFFMGMPFPKATARVGALVDWGFAVNGTASVIGSASVLLIAFNFGFKAALLTGALAYALAGAMLLAKKRWETARQD